MTSEEALPWRPGTVGFAALLVVVALVAGGAAWLFTDRADAVRDRVPANAAVVDSSTTAAAAAQVTSTLEQVWAYDYRDLDASTAGLAATTTRAFRDGYATTRARIAELAPKAQAVVTAEVVDIAVQRLRGDRAVLIAFLDQEAAKDGGRSTAGARLRVEAVRDGGRWKIDTITPF